MLKINIRFIKTKVCLANASELPYSFFMGRKSCICLFLILHSNNDFTIPRMQFRKKGEHCPADYMNKILRPPILDIRWRYLDVRFVFSQNR